MPQLRHPHQKSQPLRFLPNRLGSHRQSITRQRHSPRLRPGLAAHRGSSPRPAPPTPRRHVPGLGTTSPPGPRSNRRPLDPQSPRRQRPPGQPHRAVPVVQLGQGQQVGGQVFPGHSPAEAPTATSQPGKRPGQRRWQCGTGGGKGPVVNRTFRPSRIPGVGKSHSKHDQGPGRPAPTHGRTLEGVGSDQVSIKSNPDDSLRRSRGPVPTFCSGRCQGRSRQSKREWQPTTCVQCGAPNPPQGSGQIIKYCSAICRHRAHEANRKRHNNPCGFCGQLFKADRASRRFCSTSCNASFGNALRYADHEYAPSGKGHRGRAHRYGVEFIWFKDQEIFDRDGWRCGICGGHVDPAVRWPDPWSASLDHIVPMSLGGPHRPDNVQCAHLRCNILKGAVFDAGSPSDTERAEASAR